MPAHVPFQLSSLDRFKPFLIQLLGAKVMTMLYLAEPAMDDRLEQLRQRLISLGANKSTLEAAPPMPNIPSVTWPWSQYPWSHYPGSAPTRLR